MNFHFFARLFSISYRRKNRYFSINSQLLRIIASWGAGHIPIRSEWTALMTAIASLREYPNLVRESAFGGRAPCYSQRGGFPEAPNLSALEDANEMESEHEICHGSGHVCIMVGLIVFWTIPTQHWPTNNPVSS